MTVRIVRFAYPRREERGQDQVYEEVLKFERAYQLEDRVIAAGPLGECRKRGPRQFTRAHLKEVDFEEIAVIPYEQMVKELGGEVDALSAELFDQVVERLV